MAFEDHFSRRAQAYARFRPWYPPKLFAYLASLPPDAHRAWDCATGSGQAALGLRQHFREVIGTDPSARQLAHAEHREGVRYCKAQAEAAPIRSESIDLIVAAQALHWLDVEEFYREVRRVATAQGIIAIWGYSLLAISSSIDRAIERFYTETVGPYWPQQRRYLDERYRTIAFPFREVQPPRFEIRVKWRLVDLLGYLRTWSAVQQYQDATGLDPVQQVAGELSQLWGDADTLRTTAWPLHIRIGHASS